MIGIRYRRFGIPPRYIMIPARPNAPIDFTGVVPIDDERSFGFTVTWRPDKPLTPEDQP